MAKDEQEVRGLRRVLQTLSRWRPLVLVAIVVAFLAGAIALWGHYGRDIADDPQYLVDAESIEITKPPAWVTSDVRAEVFADAGWQQQQPSILETDLAVRVAQAFEQHSWVAKVTHVAKHHPSRLIVDIEYRRPVAMVEVDYQGQPGLLPIDRQSVLLPPEDFTVEQASGFPRITVDYSGPRGSVGTPWGDKRVAGAARIGEFLLDAWRDYGLYRIVAIEPVAATAPLAPEYELHTRGKTRIIWGHAPEEEVAPEILAAQKLARLEQYVAENGPFGESDEAVVIDLRNDQRITVRPLETRIE